MRIEWFKSQTYLQSTEKICALSRPFLVKNFQFCNCTKKVLHHHCFPNSFVKRCSSFATAKNNYMDYETTTPSKQMHDVPINYLIILTLLLLALQLALKITWLAGYSPLNLWLTIIRCLFLSP